MSQFRTEKCRGLFRHDLQREIHAELGGGRRAADVAMRLACFCMVNCSEEDLVQPDGAAKVRYQLSYNTHRMFCMGRL
jgi:hypothetical protein